MEYSKDNTMTRKEYLKSKNKSKFSFSKIKYLLLTIVVALLGVYVFNQLKVYNNVTQIANKVLEESKLAKTMTMYFVSNTYTKDGDSRVMLYKSSDESRTNIPGTENIKKISINDNKLYGLVENELYSIDLTSYTKELLFENKIESYIVKEGYIFFTTNEGIYKYNINSKESSKIINGKVYQMQVSDNNIYVIADGKTSKSIIKYDLNGGNKQELSESYTVENMYVSQDKILFTNTKDNGIYSVSKNDKKITNTSKNQVNGNNLVEYKGNVYYINKSDNNTLYRININTQKEEKVVDKNISSIQLVDNIIYYNTANGISIYKYGIETGKTDKVTSVRASEYICIN